MADNGVINVFLQIKYELASQKCKGLICCRKETVSEFPPSFYASPEAQEYIQANPHWQQGFDLPYYYPFSFVNVVGMLWRVLQQNYFQRKRIK
ncbi:MAG: hypothetical protein JSR72_23350 [Proteobacteria bacterium]|nr:hypothetical protein [Pseudomonadota bacterium]